MEKFITKEKELKKHMQKGDLNELEEIDNEPK